MKKTLLIALSVLYSSIVYGQNVSEPYKVNTNLTKDACWNKINEWVVNGFYRYHAEVEYEDKASGLIVVKGQYNPEKDGMISTLYNLNVPCIVFVLLIKCQDTSYTMTFEELYFDLNPGNTLATDINNIAVLEASTAEIKTLTRAGGVITYHSELKRNVDNLALSLADAEIKANDRTLKRKDRKYNQILYDRYIVELRVYSKAYNDMKLFEAHILREISVLFQ